jgi:hypothetical protein
MIIGITELRDEPSATYASRRGRTVGAPASGRSAQKIWCGHILRY